MPRVFAVGPAPGQPPRGVQPTSNPGGQNGANASTPDPPEAGQGCALPYHAKMCSEAAQVSTEQLIDELRAIAGNDGERVNTIEGRETAAQYARRVKATLVEREAKEREQRASAMEELKTVDLRSHSGCSRGAQLLCGALADGVLTNSLAIAAALTDQLVSRAVPPALPAAADMSAEVACAHEKASFQLLESAATSFLREGDGGEAARTRACLIMWLGAVYLNVFVSSNWTGPPMKDLSLSPLPWHRHIKAGASTVVLKGGVGGDGSRGDGEEGANAVQKALELACKQSLEVDSERFYRGAAAPLYLRAALSLLVLVPYGPSAKESSAPATLAWWGARALGTQQRLLLGRSSSLHSHLFALWDEAARHMQDSLALAAEAYEQGGRRDRDARLQLEIALAHSSFYNDAQAEKAMVAAQERSGLRYAITGKVGIRRKFQTNHLPQLVCLANSSVSAGGVGGAGGGGVVEATQYTAAGPGVKTDRGVGVEAGEQEPGEEQDFDGYRRTVGAGVTVVEKHEDVDILDGVKLDEDQEVEEQQALSNVDQAILLALCAWNRRNRARDEMNRETQAAIVDRVMLHPTNWIVFTTCLLSRCRIELSKTQTVDRACMQMQVLSEQYFDEEPGVSERVAFVYSVPFPPRWSLKKELADAMMQIGMLRTAANVFEELGLYKEMVECYVAQGEEEEAEKIVLAQLQVERSPYMLAVMGFIKEEEAWYEESWSVSGGRFAQARRWHAQLVYKRGDFKRAILLFKEALAISTFYPESWFKLGCAAMREEEWTTAVSAFQRVVTMEPESFESWGNIGAVEMGRGNFEGALNAFQEAVKLRRDSWKMWQNLRAAALNAGRWALVLNATGELLNLREKEIDVGVMSLLVQEGVARLEEARKQDKDPAAQDARDSFCDRLEVLLKGVSVKIVEEPKFWQVYARWHAAKREWHAELECLRKVLRAAQMGAWHTDADLWKTVVSALVHVTDAYLREGSTQSLFAAKSALSGAMAKGRNAFEATDDFKTLERHLARVQDAQKSLGQRRASQHDDDSGSGLVRSK